MHLDNQYLIWTLRSPYIMSSFRVKWGIPILIFWNLYFKNTKISLFRWSSIMIAFFFLFFCGGGLLTLPKHTFSALQHILFTFEIFPFGHALYLYLARKARWKSLNLFSTALSSSICNYITKIKARFIKCHHQNKSKVHKCHHQYKSKLYQMPSLK